MAQPSWERVGPRWFDSACSRWTSRPASCASAACGSSSRTSPSACLRPCSKSPARSSRGEELKDRLWAQDEFVEFDKSLNTAVQKIRQALSDSAESPRFLETVPRVGYRFVAPVQNVERLSLEEPQVRGDSKAPEPPLSPPGPKRLVEAVLLGCVIGGGLIWLLSRGAQSPTEYPTYRWKRLTHDAGLAFEPAISPDGRLVAYASDRAGEGNLDIWVQQTAGGDPIQLTNGPSDEHEPSFSPDGSEVAFRSEQDRGGIYVVSALGGRSRFLAAEGRRPRFSPDGSLIAYWVGRIELADNNNLRIVSSEGGEPQDLGPGRSPVWSPDGAYLLAAVLTGVGSENWQHDWQIVDIEDRRRTSTGAVDFLRQHGPTFDPGSTLALTMMYPQAWQADHSAIVSAMMGDRRSLWKVLLSPETGRASGVPVRLTAGASSTRSASATGNGALVVSSTQENFDVYLLPVDADQGKVLGDLQRITFSSAIDWDPSLSADGRMATFLSTRSGNGDVWTKDLHTGELKRLTATQVSEFNPVIDARGERVAYREGGFGEDYFWSASSGGPKHSIEKARGVTDWSHDGETILHLSVSRNEQGGRSLNLRDLRTGRSRLLLDSPTGALDSRFSPDDRWVAFHRREASGNRQLFVAPVPEEGQVAEPDWIAVTDGEQNDFRADWSPDGNLLYFASERDGFRCIYAQPLDPETKQPRGALVEVFHAHTSRRSLSSITSLGRIGLSVARDKIAIAMGEVTGDIWLLEPIEPERADP